MTTEKTGLDLLREPFPLNQISKLPKPTKSQTDEVKSNFKSGIRCGICGGWHHPQVIHLDYVGHAALTDRLLDCDPNWYWEPLAFGDNGLPTFDSTGGLWIRLHVHGHSRLGYGHATTSNFKEIGSDTKEKIGDALRNAAMRFGAALDLWHKGDLHVEERSEEGMKILDDEQYKALVSENMVSVSAIKTALDNEDYSTAKESWNELDEEIQMGIWRAPSKGGCFTTEQRTKMRSTEWRGAE